jgi:hypothetical protein
MTEKKRSNDELMDELVRLLKAMPEDRRGLFMETLEDAAQAEELAHEHKPPEQD